MLDFIFDLLNSDLRITDLVINGSKQIYFDRGHGMEEWKPPAHHALALDESILREWVIQKLSEAGKTWDAKHPFVDVRTKEGWRLHIAFPPISPQGLLISIRKLPQYQGGGGENLARKWRADPWYDHLSAIVRRGDSLILSGATGSGKTTLATELIDEIPTTERIIALEDTPELSPSHHHFLSLLSRPPNADGFGEVTLGALLKQCLRMRPDRIILGECRGGEVLDLLQLLNTGHRGALATLHANSPRDALRRIELLCMLGARGTISTGIIRDLLSCGIQWIAQVNRGPGGCRRISALARVEGKEGDTILLRPVLEPLIGESIHAESSATLGGESVQMG